MMSSLRLLLVCALLPLATSGCAVVAVADAAVTVAATTVSIGAKTVGLAADATIGTARLIGRAITPAEPKPGEPKPAAPAAQPAEPPAPAPDRVPAPVAAEALPVTQPQAVSSTPL
jgi:hypothetical protein